MALKSSFAAVALMAATMFMSNSAQAGTQLQNGQTIDGWKITFPATAGVQLIADNSQGLVLQLEKFAQFSSTEGLSITFFQDFSQPPAAKQISIVDESLTNETTSTFTTFQFLLVDSSGGGQNFASTFTPAGIAPWFGASDPAGGTSINLTGGTGIAPTNTAKLGFDGPGGIGGDLVINANPVTAGPGIMPAVFDLKEIPGTGTSGTTPMVPLPAAAWSSVGGLLGLGLVGLSKKLRSTRA